MKCLKLHKLVVKTALFYILDIINFTSEDCILVVRLPNANTVFPQLERARSINCRLAPRGVVFEGAL